jgi:multidrug resistance efflux pump
MSDPEEILPVEPVDEPDGNATSAGWLGRILRTLLALAILAAAGGISAAWIMNRPKAGRKRPEPQAALVEVTEVALVTETVTVGAMGTVVPAKEIQLAARVGGEIVEVAPGFVPGGRFEAGATLVRIDPKDYELAVRQRRADFEKSQADVRQRAAEVTQRENDVVKCDSDLAIEMGQQAVARREYELLGEGLEGPDKALVLRLPQLQIAKADCAAARAAREAAEGAKKAAEAAQEAAAVHLEQAKLDLERTAVRIPFNAMVRDRSVDLGAQVSANAPLASLVGTDTYWVRVLIPLDQLKWVRVPGVNSTEGSTVRITHTAAWGAGIGRTGTVQRLMPDLEPEGRMARLLVAVEDPLDLDAAPEARHPLVLRSYVRVAIEGRTLRDVISVPRTALRDGKHVWVMGPDDTLEVRDVTVVWGGNDHVCVRGGLNAGDRLVTSDLGAPVPGMRLRTREAAGDATTAPAGAGPSRQGRKRP